MPQSTNLNKAPYFDDFDPLKNFYRVLFRPGYSIQSRELTTLQSILQTQIETLAKSKFKQGSVVVPGEIIFDSQYSYVKVSSFTNNLQITDYIGKKMTGATTGIVATVIDATAFTDTDSATLFVKYENSGTSNVQKTFAEGETIIANSPGSPTAIVGITGNVKPTSSPAMGFGSAVTVKEGVYFINGTLVRNNTETVILDKYSNTPSYKVGFVINEQLVTSEEDLSLLDNAQGYSNFSAPGSHRLKITVSLVKRDISSPDQKDFVQLMVIIGGNSQITTPIGNLNFSVNDILAILARRTQDESGDYIVRDFTINLQEHLNNGSNNGLYTTQQGGDENKFAISLNPGKAYVRGYEIETTSTKYIVVDKARDTETQENIFISPLEGSNYTVKNLYSFPDIEGKTQNLTGSGLLSTNPYQEIKLYDTHSDVLYGDTTANLNADSPESEKFWILTVSNISSSGQVAVNTPYSIGSISGEVRVYQQNASQTKAVVLVTKPSSVDFIIGQTITMGSVSGTLMDADRITTSYIGISKTKYLKFLTGNSNANIYDKTSSLYKLGLFGTEYYTKVLCKNPVNFSVGKFVTGQSSGAEGIVEQILSDTNEVVLSRVNGIFQDNETILSELDGTSTPYNIIEEDSTIAYLKPKSFGSGYTTASSLTISIGGTDVTSIIQASNITITNGELRSIRITNAARLSLGNYNSSPVVTVTSNYGGNGCAFEAILNKNNVISYDASYIKSFYGSTTGNPFAGDITSKQDIFNVANGATFNAVEGSYYISADNLASRPDLDLSKGDIIEVTDNAGITRKYLVRFAVREGSGFTSRIYVYGLILSSFTGKVISRVRTKLNGLTGNSLLLPLPNKNVQTTILNPNNTNINYTVQKEFIGNFDASGAFTVTVGTNESFLNYSSDNYILSNPSNGNLIDISGSGVVSYSNSNKSLTITLTGSFASAPFKLIAPVNKSDTIPKTKVLVYSQEYQVATGFSDPVIPLQYADGYTLQAIYMSSSGADATKNDTNVTDRFIFDGGQRDTHYDLARIIRKPDAQIPTNKLLVVYDYFRHIGNTNTGDYFTVDSYTNINYKNIPSFTSSVYGEISLRDVVDFRPRVSDYTGLDTETVLPGYSDKKTTDALKFNGVGSASPAIPLFGTSYDTGYRFYLNRIDALYLTKDGSFTVSKGTPSLNPQVPSEISDGMLLYYFNIPAYTFNIFDIKTKSIDNRRYTMRDIGKLEKRIEKLEYYTVLSLLEQDTFNTQVRDEFGNERFKNGILVDNFEGHNIGNTNSIDYSCSIDMQTGVARPSYYASQTKLIEKNTNDLQRSASGYKKTGELITLPFTEQSTINNPHASTTITINPGRAAKFGGIVTLEPNIDEWKDTTIAPELIVNENSIFDTIQNNIPGSWGTIWNEWQFAWTGSANYSLSNSTSGSQFNSISNNSTSVLKGKTRTRTRNGTQNRLTPYGAATVSANDRVLSTAYNPYMRRNVVKFVARGLEPETRLYAFFDGIDGASWINPDDVTNITTPFTGIAGYAEKGFGTSIITDINGNISGQFLIPTGYAPVLGKKTFDLNSSVETFFQTSGNQRRFVCGSKSFRLTSSSINSNDNTKVSTFAETEYRAAGLVETSLGSSRFTSISRRSVLNSDTVQLIGSSQVNINQSGLLDPLAQTFAVTGFDEGVFLSSVNLYFQNKLNPTNADTERPVSLYLVETNGGIPTRNILPFSEVSLNSDTILRIKISTTIPQGITLFVGETITGKTSGATGVIKKQSIVSSANTRYNLILSNHNGVSFIAGEEFVVNRSPAITSTSFFIDQDSGIIESIKVNTFGSSYSTVSGATTVTINGDNGGTFGSVATASPKIYGGKIYEINITNSGSGYYTPPTVTIIGGDGLATAESILRITNPAVKMGVATSTDASVKTTFKFKSPVYLENNATYAFVVSTPSSDYKLYSSRVGSPLLNSIIVSSNQPNVGSLFKSQNSSAWVEDEIEDLKFNINRCVFNTSTTSTIQLTNDVIGSVKLPINPIQVDNTLGTSSLFGANQKVIRVTQPNHGMKEGDVVVLSNVSGIGTPENIFGIPVSLINGLHSVSNVGYDTYCIQIDSTLWNTANPAMTGAGGGGGNNVFATTNKVYEILQSQISIVSFPSSNVSTTIETAYGKSVDSRTTNEYTLALPVTVTSNDNYYFEDSRVIASRVNEVYRANPNLLNRKSSLSYFVSLETTKDNVSPVLDVNRANVITIGSRIDAPTGSEDRFGTKSQTLIVPTSSAYTITNIAKFVRSVIIDYSNISGGSFTNTVDSNTRLTQAVSGASGQIVSVDSINRKIKVIDIVGDFVGNNPVTQGSVVANSTTVTLKSGQIIGWDSGTGSLKIKLTSPNPFVSGDIVNDTDAGTVPVTGRTVSSVSDTGGFLFVPETNSYGSSSVSKYVTKEITLDAPATSLDCKITANLFNNRDIKVMYKLRPDGSSEDFNKINWTYFNQTGYSDNTASITPSNLRAFSSSSEDLDSYIEYKYTANNLSPFGSFAIKIVFVGSNPALAPRLEDLRVIAHS